MLLVVCTLVDDWTIREAEEEMLVELELGSFFRLLTYSNYPSTIRQLFNSITDHSITQPPSHHHHHGIHPLYHQEDICRPRIITYQPHRSTHSRDDGSEKDQFVRQCRCDQSPRRVGGGQEGRSERMHGQGESK